MDEAPDTSFRTNRGFPPYRSVEAPDTSAEIVFDTETDAFEAPDSSAFNSATCREGVSISLAPSSWASSVETEPESRALEAPDR